MPSFSKSPISSILLAFGLAVSTQAGMVTVDATSGGSMKMGTTTCSSMGASVSWSYSKSNGTWKLFYGTTNVAPPSVAAWKTSVTVAGKSGTMTATLTGLTSGTKYYATLAGWEGGAGSTAQSYAHMSFTTDGKTDGIRQETPYGAARPSLGYDAFGRSMGRAPAAGSSVQFSTQQGAQIQIQR